MKSKRADITWIECCCRVNEEVRDECVILLLTLLHSFSLDVATDLNQALLISMFTLRWSSDWWKSATHSSMLAKLTHVLVSNSSSHTAKHQSFTMSSKALKKIETWRTLRFYFRPFTHRFNCLPVRIDLSPMLSDWSHVQPLLVIQQKRTSCINTMQCSVTAFYVYMHAYPLHTM